MSFPANSAEVALAVAGLDNSNHQDGVLKVKRKKSNYERVINRNLSAVSVMRRA